MKRKCFFINCRRNQHSDTHGYLNAVGKLIQVISYLVFPSFSLTKSRLRLTQDQEFRKRRVQNYERTMDHFHLLVDLVPGQKPLWVLLLLEPQQQLLWVAWLAAQADMV